MSQQNSEPRRLDRGGGPTGEPAGDSLQRPGGIDDPRRADLRQLARELLQSGQVRLPGLGSEDLSRLAQELQVAYAELEVQFRQLQETQQRLSSGEARYRALFEDAPNGHAVVDPRGGIERANRTLGRWVGRRPFELVGTPLVAFLARGSQGAFVDYIRSVLARDEEHPSEEIELVCRGGDGRSIPVAIRGTIVPAENAYGIDGPSPGPGSSRRVLLSLVDLTRRRQLEERLQQAQKLEALGILAGGIAHDFNNTLQIVRGYAELMLSTNLDEQARGEMLRSILNAAERARQITGQIQMFSRRSMLRPEIVDLGEAVRETLELLEPLLGDDVVTRCQTTEQRLPVRLDAGQLGQLVMNLAANARDAMADGGQLSVETDLRQVGEAEAAAMPGCEAGDYALLRVVDQGCGISEQDLRRIFDPFYTTKEAGRGTGMGLASVYGIVQRAGGMVEVDSRVGEGSEFRILLPLCFDTLETEPDDAFELPEQLAGRRVLLVDDSDEVRTVAGSMLRGRGFLVEAVEGPEAALEVAARGGAGRFDIIVSDVVMPGMNGFELVERIRGFAPGVPALFISGHTRDEIDARGAELAQATVVPKPFSVEDLVRGIAKELGSDARD